MKKLSIFLLCALGIMAASCREDIEPAPPQQNDPEPVMNGKDDVVSSPVGALLTPAGTLFDLEDYNEIEAVIPVMKLDESKNLPTGASVTYTVELSDTPNFEKVQTLTTTPGKTEQDADIYYVSAEDWEAAHISLFGQTYKTKTAYFRVPVYIALAGTNYRLDNPDYYTVQGSLLERRMDPGFRTDDAYYVFGSFVGNNSIADAVQLTHSDKDAYDDPVFSYIFEVSDAEAAVGYTLNIVSETVKAAGQGEVYGFDAGSDKLVAGGQPYTISVAGPYKLEINTKTLTYKIVVASQTLYVISTGAIFNDKCLQIPTSNFINYGGFGYIATNFCLTGQKSMAPVVYGAVADAPKADEGNMLFGTSARIPIANKAKGLYWVTADVVKMKYSVTQISTIGVCGAMTEWAEGADLLLKADNKFTSWKAEIEFKAGEAWKVRANNAWNIKIDNIEWGVNYGYDNLTEASKALAQTDNDRNIILNDAGKYEVKFNCSTLPYTITITKK